MLLDNISTYSIYDNDEQQYIATNVSAELAEEYLGDIRFTIIDDITGEQKNG